MKLSLFSRCFPDLTLVELARRVNQFGFDQIDLVAGLNSKHIDIERYNDEAYIDFIKSTLSEYSLRIGSLTIHRDSQLVLGPYHC